MSKDDHRELTTLEYMVLGLMSFEPQSGYSIISTFEADYWRGSTSPGSVYPILKRLEQLDIITGEVEMVHETRARKMYTLTPYGHQLLVDWLKAPIDKQEIAEDHDTILMKFVFAEKCLTPKEILDWLDNYEQALEYYVNLLEINRNPSFVGWSIHQQLLLEATQMELNMQRTWIQMARRRLQVEYQRRNGDEESE